MGLIPAGIALLVLAGVIYWIALGGRGYEIWAGLALFVLAVAIILLVREWFQRFTTEIAVTDRRIIHKRGFIWREDQGNCAGQGRKRGCGSVDLRPHLRLRRRGYDRQAIEQLKAIAGPIEFRNHVTAEPTPRGG